MSSLTPNAFNDSLGGSKGNSASAPNHSEKTPYRSLAAAMSPLQVNQSKRRHGWSITLSPMRATHAVQALPGFGEDLYANVLFDVEQVTWCDEQGRPLTIRAIADRLSITPTECFGETVLVLSDAALLDLISMLKPRHLHIVRVDGPVEKGDAKAMALAPKMDLSPLDLELRAVMSIEVREDRVVEIDGRDRLEALAIAAENFRHYLAALRNQDARDFEAPQPWQLERLLSVSGAIEVRPIETESFATFIDVGISTETSGSPQPADKSLIYDLPSDTWHDED